MINTKKVIFEQILFVGKLLMHNIAESQKNVKTLWLSAVVKIVAKVVDLYTTTGRFR